jgi:hypothetical protein
MGTGPWGSDLSFLFALDLGDPSAFFAFLGQSTNTQESAGISYTSHIGSRQCHALQAREFLSMSSEIKYSVSPPQ